jgi:polysaccharide chain length determinant protein (PEP-CTERM system associated)
MLEEEGAGGGGFTLDRLRAAWSRRKWLGIILFAVPLTAVVTLVMALPDVYRSAATVLIEGQQVPQSLVRSTVTSELEIRLATMKQDVLGRPRLQALISRLGLYADLRDGTSEGPRMEAAVERMREDVKLELKESQTNRGGPQRNIAFELSYRGRDPQTVALVTNTVASYYVEENLKARERYASGTTEFLRTQLTESKKRLDEQEQRVSALRTRFQGELPQQAQGNIARLESLNSQLRLNNDNQIRLVERRDVLAAQVAQARADAGIESDETRLQRLKSEVATLRIKYTDFWPDIIRMKDEIANLEKQLALPKPKKPVEEMPPTPQALRLQEALKSVETELGLLKAEDQRLRKDVIAYQTRIDNAPLREQEYIELTRDYETTKEMYNALLKRYEEAQIGESMEQRQKGEQFRILQPATPAYLPAAPRRAKLLLAGLGLAVVLGVGAMVLAEILDTSFHSVDDLRSFSAVPVLVAIPRIVTEADASRRRTRFRAAAAAVLAGLVLTAGASYLVASENETLTNLLSPPPKVQS